MTVATPRNGVTVGDVPSAGDSDSSPPTQPHRVRRSSRPARRDSITISHEARRYLELVPVEPPVVAGARNALESCLSLKPGNRVLLCCETGHELVGSAFVHAANELGILVTGYVVGLEQAIQDGFVARLGAHLEDAEASIYVGRSGDAMLPIRHALAETGERRRHAEILDVTDAMMRQSLRYDVYDTHALGDRLASALGRAGALEVLGGPGSELQIAYGGEPWINASGRAQAGGATSLPEGRVFTKPIRVDGSLTTDGGVWLPDGSLLGRTLHLRFERGMLVGAEGPDAATFLDVASRLDAGRRVSRVVFGTNLGVLTPIGARTQDLLMPGLHVLLGEQGTHGASIAIAPRRPDVSMGGTPILVRGRYARSLLD